MERTAVHHRISCRWRRPGPELVPAIFALNNSFSPQYQRIRPIARSSTQLRAVWSPSSASSELFGLPIEILEQVLFFLSPDLSSFALVNSDCQYLARPLQFRCTKLRLFVDDVNTPRRHDYGALECLLQATQHIVKPLGLGLAIAPYIRHLHLHGAGIGCVMSNNREVFSVQAHLVSLIQILTNLEALSHQMPNYSALRLTAPYMLALMRSSVKHVALRGILCCSDEVYKLQSEGRLSWPVETLIIKTHWQTSNNHPDTIVPSVFVTSCSETLKSLTLDCWNALDLFTETGSGFPELHTVHLDPTIDENPDRTTVLYGHPVLSALYSTVLCGVVSIPSLKRYACSIRYDDDPERLVDNLKRNPQLESLSIMGNEDLYFPDKTVWMTLINTICRLPQLRALRLEGDISAALRTEGFRAIASMSTLQNLQLLGPLSWLDLRKCIKPGSMQCLEWLSIGIDPDYEDATDSFSMPYPTPPLPRAAYRKIDMYRTLFEAELFAAVLPALRGCIFDTMPIEIINGRARALMSRYCTGEEINQLWDHSLISTPTHLWHWD